MQIDPEDFRKHYASLSDQALLEWDRNELVEVAQRCYDAELARRRTIQRQSLPLSSKTHFETLSDQDFRALRLDDLTAGWRDRVERLTKAYQDERERRLQVKESPPRNAAC